MHNLRKFLNDDHGATLVEYGLIVAMVTALALVVAFVGIVFYVMIKVALML